MCELGTGFTLVYPKTQPPVYEALSAHCPPGSLLTPEDTGLSGALESLDERQDLESDLES